MLNRKILFIACCLISVSISAQQTAEALLDKCIAFHNPNDNWKNFKDTLNFRVEWPNKSDSYRKVFIDNEHQVFSFFANYDEGKLNYIVKGNQGSATWNGSSEIPEDISKKYRISDDRAVMYRNYYTYLYGMPMKLKDPGTILHPQVEQIEFHGKKYDRIKVTYTPEVGVDIWYFYLNPQTHALEAYQFFKDESKNDGEYILFEGIKEIDKVKMPAIRKWYYNNNGKFLATDVLE